MSVTPDNIAVALGVTAPTSGSVTYQQWELWIDDANMLIDTRSAQLNITPTDIGEAKRDYVVREAVVAHIKKPDDATQVTISVDDGSTSKSYRSSKGRVTILDEWWVLLGLTDPAGAFTLDMVPQSSAHLPWCSLNMGASYCSCGVDIAGVPIFEDADDDAWL
ncbi:Gp19/Gp15/Gp42 family protein [Microbacterium sp.]|uniref:Gp19/Gp15/Gp42 family protein n=1 Tax=Microbacterium sp. TaxID=51671 RepID=UPI0032423038